MSDLRLRQLAREARACPSAETESALLRERLRTGELSLERLELAAYCGHEGAIDFVSHETSLGDLLTECFTDDARVLADEWANTVMVQLSGSPLRLMPLGLWVSGLSRWGPSVLHLASVAAAKVALVEEGRRRGITCMCGGSIYGCDGHNFTHMCDYHGVECSCPVEPSQWLTEAVSAAEKWLGMGLHVSDHAGYETQGAYDEAWSRAHRMAPWLPAPWASDGARQTEIAGSAALAGQAATRAAIQSALISWALGEGK